MKCIVLRNSFHEKTYNFRGTELDLEWLRDRASNGDGSLSDKARIRRIRNALCGSSLCQCGMTSLRERK